MKNFSTLSFERKFPKFLFIHKKESLVNLTFVTTKMPLFASTLRQVQKELRKVSYFIQNLSKKEHLSRNQDSNLDFLGCAQNY